MILFANIVFFVTLILIMSLFAIKLREQRSGNMRARSWRQALDSEALHVKDLLSAAELDIKKIPPLVVYWGHVVIHFAALEFARAARIASSRAHALADFVSHKRNFQRGITRSEFLKKVSERKNAQAAPEEPDGQPEI